MDCIVCKFGGTSIANAEGFYKIVEILRKNPARRYIVVSAPGKRFEKDEKITDLLYRASFSLENNNYLDFECIFAIVCLRFFELERKIAFVKMREKLSEIRREFFLERQSDYFVSRGEYLAGELVSVITGFPLLAPEKYIHIKSDGSFQESSELKNILLKFPQAVIPGFYGRDDENGKIKTFPRGGGDITGAAVAEAAVADLYENWTDVDGVYVCDPKFVVNPKKITFLSYREMGRLSTVGVKVLHKDAVSLSQKAQIPVQILNTFCLNKEGTTIGVLDKKIKKYLDKKYKIAGIVECELSIQAQQNGLAEIAVIERDGQNIQKVKIRVLKALKKGNIPIISAIFPPEEETIRIAVKKIRLGECIKRIYHEFFEG